MAGDGVRQPTILSHAKLTHDTVRVMAAMRERRCPDCGSGLESWESSEGAIWECRTHGVKAWLFDDAFRSPPLFRGSERFSEAPMAPVPPGPRIPLP